MYDTTCAKNNLFFRFVMNWSRHLSLWYWIQNISYFFSSGLSVSVDVFTLVCIGIERYLAICHPFLTLKLQSMRCASLVNVVIIACVWSLGLATALPNYYMYNLCFLPKMRRFKCEKMASHYFDERLYMIALDGIILTNLSSVSSTYFLCSSLLLHTHRDNDDSLFIDYIRNVSKKYSTKNEIHAR